MIELYNKSLLRIFRPVKLSAFFMRRNTFLITCLLVSISLLGQDSLKIKETKPDPWNFRIGPYFWLININASLEKPPAPSNLPEYSD